MNKSDYRSSIDLMLIAQLPVLERAKLLAVRAAQAELKRQFLANMITHRVAYAHPPLDRTLNLWINECVK